MSGEILVVGAAGNVGRPLLEVLRAKGERVEAATRAGAPVAGTPGIALDLADPATFAPALSGVDRVFLLAPTGTTDPKGLVAPLLAAAVERKVKVVFMSVFGADADDAIPYRQIELELMASGTAHVILRPNWFADNFHTFWKAGLDHGVIAVPAGEAKTSFIAVRDIAESAAAALTTERFDGQAFDLTGPEALSYGEAATVLSRVLGKAVRYEALDDGAFVRLLTGAGVAEDYARFLAGIFHPVREGWTARVTDGVETLTGHRPQSLEAYARENAGKLGA